MKNQIKKQQESIKNLALGIGKAKKQIEDNARELRKFYEEHVKDLVLERKIGAGEFTEQLEALRKFDAQKRAEKTELEDLRKIEQHNLRALCVKGIAELLPSIIAKYEGKKAGPKTLNKIQNEFEEKANFRIWFKRRFMENSIDSVDFWSCGLRESGFVYAQEIGNDKQAEIIDKNNIIKGGWEIRPANQVIENPKEKLKEIYKARSKYQKTKKAAEDAYKDFREVAVNGFTAD